jgi:GNAT superfamily N-acetyltransferase
MSELRMRLARIEDAPAITVLARRVVRRWIMPHQPRAGVLALEETFSTPVIRTKLQAGQRFHLAFVDGVLAGVAAVRDERHVFQMFVGTRYQGQGIARKLWARLRKDCIRRAGTRVFTLNAALGAVPVYLRLGFVRDARPQRWVSPVISMPMLYRVGRRP